MRRKTKLFILAVLAFVVNKMDVCSQTNTYQPFPEESACFFQEDYSFDGSGYNYWWSKEVWKDDTLINGKIYTKRYYKSGEFVIHPLYYIGGIRQDIPNEKVYTIGSSGVEHDVSVNQHLNVNDTFPANQFRSFFSEPSVIESIDSILLGSKYYKRYNLRGVESGLDVTGDYICGIGSTYLQGFEWGQGLQCLKVNGEEYIGEGCPYCEATYGIGEKIAKDELSVFPNPFIGEINIEKCQGGKYEIINLEGKTLLTGKIDREQLKLNLGFLSKGVYFLKIYSQGYIMVQKIVKMQ